MGSAPPERAGAASGVSETGAELGGALGISILGSVGVAIYRGEIAASLPAGIPSDVAAIAKDTLGAAVVAAAGLPAQDGAALIRIATDAFVHGMQVAAVIGAIGAAAVAILSVVTLRNIGPTGEDGEAVATESHPQRAAAPGA